MLEYMLGVNMHYRVTHGHNPSPHQVYKWIKQILIAIVKLHAANITHDNVSARSVFFRREGDSSDLRLGGFVLTPTPSRGTQLVKKNVNLLRRFMRASGGGLSGAMMGAGAAKSLQDQDTNKAKLSVGGATTAYATAEEGSDSAGSQAMQSMLAKANTLRTFAGPKSGKAPPPGVPSLPLRLPASPGATPAQGPATSVSATVCVWSDCCACPRVLTCALLPVSLSLSLSACRLVARRLACARLPPVQ